MTSQLPFVRVRGGLELRLSPEESDVLRPLLTQMLEVLETESEAEDARRLFPPAYLDDDEAEADFRRFTRDELLEGKRRSLRIADSTFDKARLRRGKLAARIDGEEQQAWLSSLNDLRLFLGTRLNVSEDMYDEVGENPDPAMQIYLYLGWLQESLLSTLL